MYETYKITTGYTYTWRVFGMNVSIDVDTDTRSGRLAERILYAFYRLTAD